MRDSSKNRGAEPRRTGIVASGELKTRAFHTDKHNIELVFILAIFHTRRNPKDWKRR